MHFRSTLLFLLPLILLLTSAEVHAQYVADDSPISIAEARDLPLGSTVTITGWVSVANEFGGPSFIQDNTAGMAIVSSDFSTTVATGDSVVVTGTLGETGNSPFTTGTGLRHVSGGNFEFNHFPESNQVPVAVQISIEEMNSGDFESQLVQLISVPIFRLNDTELFTGSFAGNTNYTVRKDGISGILRISSGTDIVGTPAPDDNVDVTGVIRRFRGTYELLPRSLNDLIDNPFVLPGSDLPLSSTLDVMTWNIEWFGDESRGPSDLELQFQNVKLFIEETQMDIYALQEIASASMFARLVDELEDYSGFISPMGLTQRLAYLYNTKAIDSLSSGNVAIGSSSIVDEDDTSWPGGRSPLMFEFNFTAENKTRRVRAINIHAKAFSSQSDYEKRVANANLLKQYADSRNRDDKLIILGDYNDDVVFSTYQSNTSPYQIFVDDPRYEIVSRVLSLNGDASYPGFFNSMIDHITINEKLFDYHIDGAQRVFNPDEIVTNYLSTTSDHYPVYTRFHFNQDVSADEPYFDNPVAVTLSQNYPNPFNPTTNIRFTLDAPDQVKLSVYDVTGRHINTLVDNSTYTSGTHEVRFDGSALSSGLYLYILQTGSGIQLTQKMMLIK
ncbi:MAG: DUF5689 domain-containing protein [Balneolales bacterium]|nr:DUF5689 domain-containing protein [Balneolales bacterium]